MINKTGTNWTIWTIHGDLLTPWRTKVGVRRHFTASTIKYMLLSLQYFGGRLPLHMKLYSRAQMARGRGGGWCLCCLLSLSHILARARSSACTHRWPERGSPHYALLSILYVGLKARGIPPNKTPSGSQCLAGSLPYSKAGDPLSSFPPPVLQLPTSPVPEYQTVWVQCYIPDLYVSTPPQVQSTVQAPIPPPAPYPHLHLSNVRPWHPLYRSFGAMAAERLSHSRPADHSLHPSGASIYSTWPHLHTCMWLMSVAADNLQHQLFSRHLAPGCTKKALLHGCIVVHT